METNGAGWTAVIVAFWSALLIAILAGIKATVSRVWVPRDAVQRKLLEDMQADIAALTGKMDAHGIEIACLKGVVGSQGEMIRTLTIDHDG